MSKRWENDGRGRGSRSVSAWMHAGGCGEGEDDEGRLERGVTAGNHTEKWIFNYEPTGAGRYGSLFGPTRARLLFLVIIYRV